MVPCFRQWRSRNLHRGRMISLTFPSLLLVKHSSRLARYSIVLQNYDIECKYIKGDLQSADSLTRLYDWTSENRTCACKLLAVCVCVCLWQVAAANGASERTAGDTSCCCLNELCRIPGQWTDTPARARRPTRNLDFALVFLLAPSADRL